MEKIKKRRNLKKLVVIMAGLLFLSLFLVVGSVAHADIQTSADLAETSTQSVVKIIGNSGLFICLLIFGVCQFFGVEIGRWGKKLVMSALLGTAVILNAEYLRDLIWGNLGTS